MKMVVIYDRPHDAPNGFLVRSWDVTGAIVVPGKLLGSDLGSLEAARACVPVGMVNIGRTAQDDPKIVEVWL